MSEVKELLSKGANVNYHSPEKGFCKVNSMRNHTLATPTVHTVCTSVHTRSTSTSPLSRWL